MKIWSRLIAGTMLLSLGALAVPTSSVSSGTHPALPPGADDPTAPPSCATGCAAIATPEKTLSLEEYELLLQRFAAEPPSAESAALEALLFHGAEARRLLAQHGPGPLDRERAALLGRELARRRVLLSLRLVGEEGVVRASFGPRSVPLDDRRHLAMTEATDLSLPEISGSVRRVGLNHLWTRW